MRFKEYVRAQSLEEAWELNQKRSNRVIGGMLWMKMSDNTVHTVIDLSALGLDKIEETEEEFQIGCMVSLRQLEKHQGFQDYTNGAAREAIRHIVGVQFRNLATVGGSIFGRYGFSDILTLFFALDSYVELYKGGRVPMEKFVCQKRDNDILVRVIVKKIPAFYSYQSVRGAQTDFPILTCAGARTEEGVSLVFGARPGRAVKIRDEKQILNNTMSEAGNGFAEEEIEAFGRYCQENVIVGSNLRGSAAYRSHLVKVLAERIVARLGGEEHDD